MSFVDTCVGMYWEQYSLHLGAPSSPVQLSQLQKSQFQKTPLPLPCPTLPSMAPAILLLTVDCVCHPQCVTHWRKGNEHHLPRIPDDSTGTGHGRVLSNCWKKGRLDSSRLWQTGHRLHLICRDVRSSFKWKKHVLFWWDLSQELLSLKTFHTKYGCQQLNEIPLWDV